MLRGRRELNVPAKADRLRGDSLIEQRPMHAAEADDHEVVEEHPAKLQKPWIPPSQVATVHCLSQPSTERFQV